MHPKYQFSREMLDIVHTVAHHPRALRTAHSLLHAMTRHHDDLPSGHPLVVPQGSYWTLAAELRGRIGLGGAKSNRALRDGMAELVRAGIVQCFAFHNGGEELVWRTLQTVPACLMDPSIYGLHDIAVIAELKRPLSVVWYSETIMVKNMDTPKFVLDVDFLGCIHDRDAMAGCGAPYPVRPWEDIRGPVLRAAEAVATREDVTFVIVAKRGRMRRGAGALEVRVLRPVTRWWPGTLSNAAGKHDRVYVVAPGGGTRHHPPQRFDLAAARAICGVQRRQDAAAPAA